MSSRSHQGLVRLNNEDCVHCEPDHGFAVLADGMGGLMAGEVASGIAVDAACKALRQLLLADPCMSPSELEEALSQANDAVVARAKSMRYVGKMGTTLVVWVKTPAGCLFGHVGDSRLYTYSAEGVLTQVTTDHTVAQRMVNEGAIPADQAHTAPNRHVLTQAVGIPGLFQAEVGEVPVTHRILLCSDGLSDLVSDEAIAEIMATPDLDDCTNFLLKAALDKGGRDNVTVAIIEF